MMKDNKWPESECCLEGENEPSGFILKLMFIDTRIGFLRPIFQRWL